MIDFHTESITFDDSGTRTVSVLAAGTRVRIADRVDGEWTAPATGCPIWSGGPPATRPKGE